MADDRANNPARRPNLGVPDFVSAVKTQHRYKKPQPNVTVTKRTELPTATREVMMEKDKPVTKKDVVEKDLRETNREYLESKDHG